MGSPVSDGRSSSTIFFQLLMESVDPRIKPDARFIPIVERNLSKSASPRSSYTPVLTPRTELEFQNLRQEYQLAQEAEKIREAHEIQAKSLQQISSFHEIVTAHSKSTIENSCLEGKLARHKLPILEVKELYTLVFETMNKEGVGFEYTGNDQAYITLSELYQAFQEGIITSETLAIEYSTIEGIQAKAEALLTLHSMTKVCRNIEEFYASYKRCATSVIARYLRDKKVTKETLETLEASTYITTLKWILAELINDKITLDIPEKEKFCKSVNDWTSGTSTTPPAIMQNATLNSILKSSIEDAIILTTS